MVKLLLWKSIILHLTCLIAQHRHQQWHHQAHFYWSVIFFVLGLFFRFAHIITATHFLQELYFCPVRHINLVHASKTRREFLGKGTLIAFLSDTNGRYNSVCLSVLLSPSIYLSVFNVSLCFAHTRVAFFDLFVCPSLSLSVTICSP